MVTIKEHLNEVMNEGLRAISSIETKLSIEEGFTYDVSILDAYRMSSLRLQMYLTHLFELSSVEDTPENLTKVDTLINGIKHVTINLKL